MINKILKCKKCPIGIIQKSLIELAKKKGYVTTNDVFNSWKSSDRNRIAREMNKLIVRGYFAEGKDTGLIVKWKYVGPR